MNLNFFNGNNMVHDDLSPVSALRLNFDRLPTETTDPIEPTKNVFGVPVPQFVPESIISWLDNTYIDTEINQTNQSDTQSNGSASEKIIISNNELSNTTRKVCIISLTERISLIIKCLNRRECFFHFIFHCNIFSLKGGQCTDD